MAAEPTARSAAPTERFLLAAGETALRLPGVERRGDLTVALPVSYAQKRRRAWPLVILPWASGCGGALIEMSRIMAQTKELPECVVACADGGDAAAVERECRRAYRINADPAVVLAGAGLPALVAELRAALGTGHEYGSEVLPLRHRGVMRALTALAPLFARAGRGATAEPAPERHRIRAGALDRDFEVFAAFPAGAPPAGTRLPVLVVLDVNIELALVVEAAARAIAAGRIAPLAVVGVGTPRSEGHVAFAFRRFEELSPPNDGYAWDDELGNVLRGMFAIRGQDARARMGRAPQFLDFLARELLPALARELPVDTADAGILGHSAGGAFVCWAMTAPDSPFSRYAAVSPGLGMSGSVLLQRDAAAALAPRARRAFLCLGGEEADNRFNRMAGIHQTEGHAERLRAHAGLDVQFRCFGGQTHSTVVAHAVEAALPALYADTGAAAANGSRGRAGHAPPAKPGHTALLPAAGAAR